MHDVFAPVRAALEHLDAAAGIVVRDPAGRELFRHAARETFPAASVIKVPLVMALFADVAEGRLSLDERIAVGEKVDGSGILRDLRDVDALTLRDHVMLAIALSDNTATNRVIERVGPERVNERLEDWGCTTTRLRRRMYDFEAARQGLENVVTPQEMASLVAMVVSGRLVDRTTSDAVLAIMERCQDESMLRRYLPDGVRAANKTGTIEGTRNDVAVIWGPIQTLVVAAFTREARDPIATATFLGTVGWCAARAAGIELPALPIERVPSA